jgi:magnesium-transporting ATPase (P-type)
LVWLISPRGVQAGLVMSASEELPDCVDKSAAETLAYFKVDSAVGLTAERVAEGQKRYGPNELPAEEKQSLFSLILEQFDDMLVKILLVAAGISFVRLGVSFFSIKKTFFFTPYCIVG